MHIVRVVVLSGVTVLFALGAGVFPPGASHAEPVSSASSETVTRAMNAYHRGQYRRALRLLRPYVRKGNTPAAIQFILGKIYYAANDFKRAYHFSRRAAPSLRDLEMYPHVKRLKERSRHLSEIDFRRETHRQFHVLVPHELPPGLAGRLNHGLMRAYREVGGDLGYFPEAPITLIVYPKGQFRNVVKAPAWSTGLFDSKIHLLYRRDRTPPYDAATLVHEYTHAVIYSLAQENVPVWFNEGMATHQEQRHSPDGGNQLGPPSLPPGRSLPSPEEVDGLFQAKNGRKSARRAYRLSLSMVRYLRQRHGPGAMKRLLKTAGRTGSFPEAFRRVTGASLATFHRRWERWLRERVR